MDDFEVVFGLLMLTILALALSCAITNARIDTVNVKIDKLEKIVVPVKTPEQIKLEELEKQIKDLRKDDNDGRI